VAHAGSAEEEQVLDLLAVVNDPSLGQGSRSGAVSEDNLSGANGCWSRESRDPDMQVSSI